MDDIKFSDDINISAERSAYLKSLKRTKKMVSVCRVGILILLVAAWELSAQFNLIDNFILSQPSRIGSTFINMAQYDLINHIWVTVYETLVGFILGVITGTCLAVTLWWSDFVAKVSEPYLVVLNSLPKIALGPVIIIIVGAGTEAIIFMALAISLIVTVLEMLNGFRHTDSEYIRMASTFGATKLQIFLKVVFPYNIATLFNSLKINIGLSLVGVIAGEFLVSKAGLGYLIVYGGQVFKMDLVMSSVIILAAVAALMYEGVVLMQRVAMRWYNR